MVTAHPRITATRKWESQLKHNFKFSSFSFRAVSANSIKARATFVWAEELAKEEKELPNRVKDTLKKISLAAAFAADSSLDMMHYYARAMAANTTTRHSIWLRSWSGNSGSQAKLIGAPFEGGKLFGSSLEPLLMEAKDKRKVLV